MGIAIIKGEFGANALCRTRQNVTPKDSNRRKSFTNNNLQNVVWGLQNGVYEVAYIDLGQATQHYKYVICNSNGDEITQAGVNINEITGTIRLDANYEGGDVYAKVVPIINEYYPTAIATSAVLVKEADEVQDNYVLSFAYNNSQGIDARPRQVSMTSFSIKNNGVLETEDRSSLTNVSVVAKVNGIALVSSNSITQDLSIPGNEGDAREIVIVVQGNYEGSTVSNSFILPQGADGIDTIGAITYSGSLVAGTTIDPHNFSALATMLSGKTPYTVYGQSVSPETITNGVDTYTVTFVENKQGTIQLTSVSKASISLPSQPYPTANSTANDGSIITMPLTVNVTNADGTDGGSMLFTEFLAATNLGQKETYGNPQITFSSNAMYNNMPNLDNGSGVGSDGTLTFDLTKPNYVYDKTKITGISIPCTSGGTSINATLDYSVGAQKLNTTYFQNMTSVKLDDLTSDQLNNLNIIKHTGKKVSASSLYSQYPNQLYIETGDSSNIYYELPYNANGYIIGIIGGANVGIISDTSLGSLYTINQNDIKGLESSSSSMLYIKHTPSSGKSTFLLKTNSGNGYWWILTPSN